MAYLGKKPSEIYRASAVYDSFTGDGSTTAFDLTYEAGSANDIIVVVNNVRQEPGSTKSYTLGLDGNNVRRRVNFVTAPAASDAIYVINPTVPEAIAVAGSVRASAITNETELAEQAADGDYLLIYDTSASTIKKIQKSNIASTYVEWQSVFVGDGSTGLTAVAGQGYFVDTTSGAVTVTLPSSPSAGDIVVLKDYARTWNTNAITIASALLDGVTGTTEFSTEGQSVTLVYMDGTKGWSLINEDTTTNIGSLYVTATGGTVATSGDYKIHTFTGDGTFVVSCAGNDAGSNSVDYLVVAGGGGGGSGYSSNCCSSGGGGAGGFRESCGGASGCYSASPLAAPCAAITVTATTYPVTVGAGGTEASKPGNNSTPGSNSVFSTITSSGGGNGGSGGGTLGPSNTQGGSGGSGGGNGGDQGCGLAGTGNTPPVSPPQGNPGGQGNPSSGYGGGGGATAAGANGTPKAASGGAGATTSISGTSTTYAGGGGAGGNNGETNGGSGGSGGGGGGGDYPAGNAQSATANTGGGGGGAGSGGAPNCATSGAGGKGIVVIRYKYQ